MIGAAHHGPFGCTGRGRPAYVHRTSAANPLPPRPVRLATVTTASDGGGKPGKNASASARRGLGPGADDPQRPAYEQARDELTELVKRLEAGGLTLEQSLQLWERGEQLAAICEEWLEGARARLATATAQHHQQYQEPTPGAPF